MKIALTIPVNFSKEISYTWSCLLEVFLGVEFDVLIDSSTSDSILKVNGNEVVFKNHFFQDSTIHDLYRTGNLPTDIVQGTLIVNNKELSIISLYGSCSMTDNVLDSDIIASTFFMLTRWEECISDVMDEHNRFSAYNSIAYKSGFLGRPIVNEYVELVWALLIKMGFSGERIDRKYTVVPTHDIDHPYLWSSMTSKIRSFAFSLFTIPSIDDLRTKTRALFSRKDIYDSFDLLIKLADNCGSKAYFNFMAGGNTVNDPSYDISNSRLQRVIKVIIGSGHEIGFHPSYVTYNSKIDFQSELVSLEQLVGQRVTTGRQHYLRFDASTTWSIWDDMNMIWDSTLGYSEELGFRCGVCYSFPVYDIFSRKQLDLVEKPLLVMDVTLMDYKKYDAAIAIMKVEQIKNEVKKYNGEFVFLWHNSSFSINGWNNYEVVLKSMYK